MNIYLRNSFKIILPNEYGQNSSWMYSQFLDKWLRYRIFMSFSQLLNVFSHIEGRCNPIVKIACPANNVGRGRVLLINVLRYANWMVMMLITTQLWFKKRYFVCIRWNYPMKLANDTFEKHFEHPSDQEWSQFNVKNFCLFNRSSHWGNAVYLSIQCSQVFHFVTSYDISSECLWPF